eukprot:5483269-Prorocentrum_lima.AAC.1
MTAQPKAVVKTCMDYGCQSSVDITTRTLTEIIPTSDLSRVSTAQELQVTSSKVPRTLAQFGK